MRIQCPSCGAAGTAAEGRSSARVRCPQCGHRWEISPPESAPPTPARTAGTSQAMLEYHWSTASDEEVLKALVELVDPKSYRPEARKVIRDEARKRKLVDPDPEQAAALMLPKRPRRRRVTGFRAGDVIGKGLSIWGRNFLPFTAMTLIVSLPLLAFAVWILVAVSDHQLLATYGLINDLGTMLVSQLVTAIVIAGVFQQLRGAKPDIGRSISTGFSRLLPVLGVAIVSLFCLGIVMIPALIAYTVGMETELGGCFGGALMLATTVLALYVYCALWLAVPVAVVEKPGVFASIARSWRLTKGSCLSIFGILFLLGLIVGLGSFVIGLAFGLGTPMLGALGEQAANIVFLSMQAVVTCVGYYKLRVSKEGIEEDELAAIFD
jgi:hypothetical protein